MLVKMKGIPNTKHIIHRKHLDVYEIIKNVNGKNEYFGRYHTLPEAIKWRDYFKENNWNLNLRLIGTPNRNIYFKLGKWRIIKKINGKDYYFGSFDNLEDAEKRVKEIRLTGWSNIINTNSRLLETTTKNIVKLPNGKYEIVKTINHTKYTFGIFNTYEEAEKEVKLLRQCEWDYEALCESINETDKGITVFLDKLMVTSFEKKHSRPEDHYWAKHEGLI